MPQYGRPSADTSIGEYSDNAGGTTNIYAAIDEASPDDADFIRSGAHNAGAGAKPYATKLSSAVDPASPAGHKMRFRYSVDQDAQEPVDFGLQLRQGYVSEGSPGTLIASHPGVANVTSTAWVTSADYTLGAAEADAITDYSNLYYRFICTWT